MNDVFKRNIDAFDKMGLHNVTEILKGFGDIPIKVVGNHATSDLNIDLGNTHLYSGNAETFATGQVQQYLAAPNRFCVNPPALDSPYVGLEKQLYSKITKAFPSDMLEPSGNDAGYLISYGLGLGLHIPKLLKSIDVRDIIIVEQFWEFILLSLQTIDWQPICSEITSKGGEIHFVVGTEPGKLSNKIYKILRGDQFGLIDGSYGIQHYNSPLLTQTHGLFREMLATLGMSAGFFDDECLMFKNAAVNLFAGSAKNFVSNASLLNDVPVFVVGSGPSVDDAISAIKKNSDKALIISAGTGLGVLLRAGIKPHMHCEIENVTDIYDAIMRVGSAEDFDDIILMASNTVDPRVLAAFKSKITYFRDNLTSSRLFAKDDEVLHLSGPTVSNLACRTAIALGARDIYLFGIDLGSVDPAAHHSKDSAYFRSTDEYWQSGAGLAALDQEIKGNFRPKVYTNGPFLLTRTYFNELIAAFPAVNFHNCSDGAYLEGALPTPPFKMALSRLPNDLKVDLLNFYKSLLTTNCGDINYSYIIDSYNSNLMEWYNQIREILSRNWHNTNFINFYDEISPLLLKVGGRTNFQQAAVTCNAGTAMMMIQFAYAYSRRIEHSKFDLFMAEFCQEMSKVIDVMQQTMDKLLSENRKMR